MRSEGRETESSPKSSQESRRAISDSSCSFCGLDPEGKDFVRNQNIYFYDLKKTTSSGGYGSGFSAK